jgi:Family of unknown function (DUF6188)
VSTPLDDAGLADAGGKWVLPVGEGKVTQLRVDFAFTLVLEARIEVRIEAPFSYGAAGDARLYEPSDSRGLAPLLGLHQATVTSAEIGKDGTLTMAFTGGGQLVVPPDERYEAFTVAGSLPAARGGFSFVALPGGGLARF